MKISLDLSQRILPIRDFQNHLLSMLKMKVPVAKLEMENHQNEDSFLGLVLDMDKVSNGYF